MDRQKIIKDCVVSLYYRYRKRVPEERALNIEVKLAIKDLYEVPTSDLKECFAYAYRLHEKDRPPITKEILAYWRAREGSGVKVSGCGECAGGLISAEKREKSCHLYTGKEIEVSKGYAFRCECALGARMSKEIPIWENQKGFTRKG